MPDINFQGPAGRLEGKYFAQKNNESPIAVILHPHPLHGGTMNNKTTYRLFETFVRHGFSVLRFNFRGVGNSEGTFDNGVGELSDAAAALDWLHAQHSHTPEIWLAGFSFGSWITLQMLMRRPDLKRFVAVAPPMGLYDFTFLSPCPTSGLVVYGTADEITAPQDTENMLKKTTRQKGITISAAKIIGADHFFINQQDDLAATVGAYIQREMGQPGR
ncbi:MAG: alpha/beta fold hydrolase [Proteobacteria bacterium]|nr:alpha/beta fold hydrolase [Pseudomonadota bacterium]